MNEKELTYEPDEEDVLEKIKQRMLEAQPERKEEIEQFFHPDFDPKELIKKINCPEVW